MSGLALSVVALILLLAAAAGWFLWRRRSGIGPGLAPGRKLPALVAEDADGNRVSTGDLAGRPAVLLFVRGNWCPFCSEQVEQMMERYRELTEQGARLVLITPKPQEMTERIAGFFEVELSFWFDPELRIARRLGLVMTDGVPETHRREYGADTMWPAAIVIDGERRILMAHRSRDSTDRPDPEDFLRALRRLPQPAAA